MDENWQQQVKDAASQAKSIRVVDQTIEIIAPSQTTNRLYTITAFRFDSGVMLRTDSQIAHADWFGMADVLGKALLTRHVHFSLVWGLDNGVYSLRTMSGVNTEQRMHDAMVAMVRECDIVHDALAQAKALVEKLILDAPCLNEWPYHEATHTRSLRLS